MEGLKGKDAMPVSITRTQTHTHIHTHTHTHTYTHTHTHTQRERERERKRELFIGTQSSNLCTAVDKTYQKLQTHADK